MPHLNVNLPPDVHEVARVAASSRGESLQLFILGSIRERLLRMGATDTIVAAALDRAAGREGR